MPYGDTYFEDLKVGQKFVSPVGRTVLDSDNVWFSLLTLNPNQSHFNADYTKKNFGGEPFAGRLLVNGTFTLALVVGLSVGAVGVQGVMVGLDEVRFPHPVFAGDTVYAEVEVLEARESRSRPGFGVVRFKTRGYNQEGATVVEFVRTVLVPKRGAKW